MPEDENNNRQESAYESLGNINRSLIPETAKPQKTSSAPRRQLPDFCKETGQSIVRIRLRRDGNIYRYAANVARESIRLKLATLISGDLGVDDDPETPKTYIIRRR
jgi:hypothetical protein